MKITKESVIGQIVAENYKTSSVFKKEGIDFCCNGERTLSEACNNDEELLSKLIKSLETAVAEKDNSASIEFNYWPLDLLSDYIEKKHHRYVEAKTPEIRGYLEKTVQVHGDKHPELNEVGRLFNETAGQLAMHMKKEELTVFPVIRKMVKTGKKAKTVFGSIKVPIETMMSEHDDEGERFRQIAALTNNYTLPQDGCETYRITLALLQEFENDLHLHIHLENNILFPKAIELEESLMDAG